MMAKAPRALAAAFSTHVKWSGNGQVDPIMAPGQAQSAHLHSFMGAPIPTPDMTPAGLRTAAVSNSSGIPDSAIPDYSAYWLPALYLSPDKTGRPAHPQLLTAYWRSKVGGGDNGFDPATVLPWPEDLAYVAGNGMATDVGQNPHTYWSAISSGSTVGDHLDLIPDRIPVQFPDGGKGILRATIQFPSCYDGAATAAESNWTPHLTYPIPAPAGSLYSHACPDGSYAIPEVDLVFRYDPALAGFPVVSDPAGDYYDMTGATLASDNMTMEMPDGSQMTTGGHGVTLHADLMTGFVQADVNTLIGTGYRVDTGGPRNLGVVRGNGES